MNKWILDKNLKPRKASHEQWAKMVNQGDGLQLSLTKVTGSCTVSTVFMGHDLDFEGDGSPLLYESMIVGGPLHGIIRKYINHKDALFGHIKLVFNAIDEEDS